VYLVGFYSLFSSLMHGTMNMKGKPEVAIAVVVAPDDGHEGARNMLSCI
jgi:hypothetical protein